MAYQVYCFALRQRRDRQECGRRRIDRGFIVLKDILILEFKLCRFTNVVRARLTSNVVHGKESGSEGCRATQ